LVDLNVTLGAQEVYRSGNAGARISKLLGYVDCANKIAFLGEKKDGFQIHFFGLKRFHCFFPPFSSFFLLYSILIGL
jgi:hypothetical protein